MKRNTTLLTAIFIALLFVCSTNDTQAQLKVKSNGYVGVGTTNPAYRLHVNGVARATNFYINNSSTRLHEGANNAIRLRTNFGYGDIGAQNTSWFHFTTDRAAFWFNKRVEVNGHFNPYSNNLYYNGSYSKRWNRGYFTTLYRVNEYSLSDKRSKENVRNISNALNVVLQLKGYLYDYKSEVFMPGETPIDWSEKVDNEASASMTEADNSAPVVDNVDRAKLTKEANILRKDKYGFMAQDVQKIIPSVVHVDEEGTHTLSYTELIPILVEAIKEQQAQIDKLQAIIDNK